MDGVIRVGSRDEFLALVGGPAFARHRHLEQYLAEQHREADQFAVPGYCLCCERPVDFLVDWRFGGSNDGEGARPNWRERLECPGCHLNNRQRMIAGQVAELLRGAGEPCSSAYLMEQITPIFRWFLEHFPDCRIVGSEYLGPDLQGGSVRDGIRHEDAERLSFEDASFDVVVSNEVLEHVNDPFRCMQEMARILRPSGQAFLTIPFDVSRDHNRRRAEIRDGQLHHLEEPAYHGNPLSEEGSLVFTDFGWEALAQLREAGFADVGLHVHWSYELGHLGPAPSYFHLIR
ncbi:class I SAM-dependent methyltransferase [Tautonia marina]|uniref:class I SAM-dependent methyltransferase n=1 Tax=Tautonia marina TaxID=2653855 RepID=UPI001260F66C|nr:class I SAM-dependent methyltransferase [Tautonia marina]